MAAPAAGLGPLHEAVLRIASLRAEPLTAPQLAELDSAMGLPGTGASVAWLASATATRVTPTWLVAAFGGDVVAVAVTVLEGLLRNEEAEEEDGEADDAEGEDSAGDESSAYDDGDEEGDEGEDERVEEDEDNRIARHIANLQSALPSAPRQDRAVPDVEAELADFDAFDVDAFLANGRALQPGKHITPLGEQWDLDLTNLVALKHLVPTVGMWTDLASGAFVRPPWDTAASPLGVCIPAVLQEIFSVHPICNERTSEVLAHFFRVPRTAIVSWFMDAMGDLAAMCRSVVRTPAIMQYIAGASHFTFPLLDIANKLDLTPPHIMMSLLHEALDRRIRALDDEIKACRVGSFWQSSGEPGFTQVSVVQASKGTASRKERSATAQRLQAQVKFARQAAANAQEQLQRFAEAEKDRVERATLLPLPYLEPLPPRPVEQQPEAAVVPPLPDDQSLASKSDPIATRLDAHTMRTNFIYSGAEMADGVHPLLRRRQKAAMN